MPDYPARMSISAAMCLSLSCSQPTCYLQDRDEIADDVIIAQPQNHCVKVIPMSVHLLTVQSDINLRATVASIKVLFRGIKASIRLSSVLAHAYALGILHYQECYIAPTQGILPTFQLGATARGAFMPDSTLGFLPIFSSLKCTKTSMFSGFLHSLQWFDPQKSPRCFQA